MGPWWAEGPKSTLKECDQSWEILTHTGAQTPPQHQPPEQPHPSISSYLPVWSFALQGPHLCHINILKGSRESRAASNQGASPTFIFSSDSSPPQPWTYKGAVPLHKWGKTHYWGEPSPAHYWGEP